MALISATTPDRAAPPTAPAAPPGPPLWALLRDACARPGRRATAVGGAACLGLLGAVFWANLRHFAYVWATDGNYSHGFLVPLMSLYFANEAARRGPVSVRGGAWLGTALLATAMLGKLATVLVPVGIVGDLALLLGLAGLCALLAGREALRRYGFALGFLAFMVPLPVHLYTTIASPLQGVVSRIAAAILNATGIPVLAEGNLLTLPGDVRMFVAEACSGMRQLTGFLALTAAVAYLAPRPSWYRAVVVLAAVPVALTANVARVTLTGWIMSYDPRLALGTFHTVEGLLMMGFGLALLSLGCKGLDLIAGATGGIKHPEVTR